MRLVILHYHIFKNAGTTIEQILDHSFGERFLALDVPGLDRPVPNAELVRHLESGPDFAAVSSHQIRHPVPCVPGYLFFDICFLRDPFERFRSTYDYYRIKPDPSDPLSELAVRTSLGEFMASMIRDFRLYSQNVQVNLLACEGDSDEPSERDLELAIARMRETSFLGVVDLFDESVVAGEYGLRRVFPELDSAIPAANVSRGMEGAVADRAAQLRQACGDEVYQELLSLNQLDLRLVGAAREEVRRRFQSVPDGEARLQALAARRRQSSAAAPPPGRKRRRVAQADKAGFPTILRRAVKLAPYLQALRGPAGRALFDAVHYREICPEAGDHPLLHFLVHGGFSGVAPHPLFDAALYLDRYPDVAASGVNPLAHYLKHGAREGRQPHPLFDQAFYLEHSPDLRSSGQNPLAHYVLHGAAEGRRPHPLFDPEHYRKSARLGPGYAGNLLVDFLCHGTDAASPHPLFDCEAWVAANPGSDENPLVGYVRKHGGRVSLPVAVVNEAGGLEWIAEPQQMPFLRALRADQVIPQIGDIDFGFLG